VLAEAIRALYGYNRWATERVLDAAAGLTPEQLHAPGGAGRGSIRDTLLHLIHSHNGWLSWWDGSLSVAEAYGRPIPFDAHPDLPSVRAYWEATERQTEAFVSGLTDADVARVYDTKLPNGIELHPILWQMLLHVANHGTQHRSEVAAMLTTYGCSPGDLDLIRYVFEGGG
jgi:uncharacterized damage-inducible protein DinB